MPTVRVRGDLKRHFAPASRRCPSCDRKSHRSLGEFPSGGYDSPGGRFSRDRFSLFWCGCDTVFLSPLPSSEDFAALYVEAEQFTGEVYVNEERIEMILEFMSGRLTYLTSTMTIGDSGPSILEIGAGNAWMCRATKALHPEARTVAQDITDEAVDQCPWVDEYLVVDVDDLGLSETFDVVSMTHVFEHVPEPVETLKALAPFLRSDGTVFITMPFRPSGESRHLRREDWESYSYLHVPAHLQYLSERSMRTIASRAGYRVDFWDASAEGGDACEVHLSLER